MRVLIAVLAAAALGSIGIGMLRSLGGRMPHQPNEVIEMPTGDTRITFWCENCGTEVLLLRKGSDTAPRHCGESMLKREEIGRN